LPFLTQPDTFVQVSNVWLSTWVFLGHARATVAGPLHGNPLDRVAQLHVAVRTWFCVRTPVEAAILQGYRVLYRETHVLLDDLADAVADGTRKEFMESLATVPLLIIDDFGMRKLPLTAAEDLLEIIMRSVERRIEQPVRAIEVEPKDGESPNVHQSRSMSR
jgi:hypothetical protein